MDRSSFRTTTWRVHADGKFRSRVVYGMDWLAGNRQPHFSITLDRQGKRNGHWSDDASGSGGGAAHEEIAELFPELADLCRWHLCDQDGTPLHYEANGAYWYGMAAGWRERGERGPYDRDPIECFKSTVVWGTVEGDPEELPLHWNAAQLQDVLRGRLHELQNTCRRELTRAGVNFIRPDGVIDCANEEG